MTRIRAGGASDVGAIRSINEDEWRFEEDVDGALAIVADGMGGSASGRPAAELTAATAARVFASRATDYAKAWWRAEHDPSTIAWTELAAADREVIEARVREIRATRAAATPGDLAILEAEGEIVAAVARRCLIAANQAVAQRATEETWLHGMCAAAVVAVFGRHVVGIAHAGDARCYLLRAGSLRRVTVDHTLLESLLASGELPPDKVDEFPHKTVITRAIGVGDLEVDTCTLDTLPGDVFLLCSDGIWRTLDGQVLHDTLAQRGYEAAADLVAEARGTSRDNVTAVVVQLS